MVTQNIDLSTSKQDNVSLKNIPIIIIIGVTGTGKSTTLELLTKQFKNKMRILPERRILTDEYIIRPMMLKSGLKHKTLPRSKRYPYLKSYREKHPEGVAYVLSNLYLKKNICKDNTLFIFDGLRGKIEIEYALKTFQNCSFIVFKASKSTRFFRLLSRNDSHDKSIDRNINNNKNIIKNLSWLNKKEQLFLSKGLQNETFNLKDISYKIDILTKEDNLYSPEETIIYLENLNKNNINIIDTDTTNIIDSFYQARDFISKWQATIKLIN